ncbi:hypothetical protein ASD45_21000 [Pseudolabrys sp. Root1462]|nr:hypothetical protein ASD45_21000 [Pseudolabrys sp. Root1462]
MLGLGTVRRGRRLGTASGMDLVDVEPPVVPQIRDHIKMQMGISFIAMFDNGLKMMAELLPQPRKHHLLPKRVHIAVHRIVAQRLVIPRIAHDARQQADAVSAQPSKFFAFVTGLIGAFDREPSRFDRRHPVDNLRLRRIADMIGRARATGPLRGDPFDA